MNADAKWDTTVTPVTNAIHIQAVSMEIAEDHGNVIASKLKSISWVFFHSIDIVCLFALGQATVECCAMKVISLTLFTFFKSNT